MDFLKNSFANRLTTLRNAYDVSMAELTNFLFLKNISSVAAYESGKTFPSYEVLLNTSLFFGVSLDWLVGMSDNPYTDASIAAGYKALSERRLRVDPQNEIDKIMVLSSVYAKTENMVDQLMDYHKLRSPKEEEEFNKQNRVLDSNKIFLLNATFLNDLEHRQIEKKLNASKILQKVVDLFQNKSVSTDEFKRLEKKQFERYRTYSKLLKLEITEPIYKIE